MHMIIAIVNNSKYVIPKLQGGNVVGIKIIIITINCTDANYLIVEIHILDNCVLPKTFETLTLK